MTGEFAGKVVVVTGGSRGIGRAIAMAFAEKGAEIVLAANSAENLARASEDVVAAGGRPPLTISGDLKTLDAVGRVFEAVDKRHGRCDVLVNSAGATKAGSFLGLDDQAWQDGFALKFFAAVRLCRLFWPQLTKAEGHVVNIIGGAARTPSADFLIGGSVNAAFANFSKGLADLGKKDGVNVNVIHPGRTLTDRTNDLLRQKAAARGVSTDIIEKEEVAKDGIRRMGLPEDIATLTLFLCSQAARHIQGTAIAVDGGATSGLY